MADPTTSTEESAKHAAVQAVIDRVAAWQHGVTDGTVRDERHEADDGPIDAAKLIRSASTT